MVGLGADGKTQDGIQQVLVFEVKEAKHRDWLRDQLFRFLPFNEVVTKDRPLWDIVQSGSNPRSVIFADGQMKADMFKSLACGETVRLNKEGKESVSAKINFVPIFITENAASQLGTDAGVMRRIIKLEVTKIPEDGPKWTKKALLDFIDLCLAAYDTFNHPPSS